MADNIKEYNIHSTGQCVLQINQTFEGAMGYCQKQDATLLYPGDRRTNILTSDTNMSSIWLNMKRISFQHLRWMDNASLGLYYVCGNLKHIL